MGRDPLGCREFRTLGRSTRRQFLQVGVLGGLGLALPQVLRHEAVAKESGKGTSARAKSVILLWLQGGVSHHETFDTKPDASSDIRGPYDPIATNLPGVQIGEFLPMLATRMDRLAVIRSVTHRESAHERGMRNMLACRQPDTGFPPPNRHPDVGAVVGHELGSRGGLPPYVIVPGNDFTANIKHYHTGFLPSTSGPFLGIHSEAFKTSEELTAERFGERAPLRAKLDRFTDTALGGLPDLANWDEYSGRAEQLVLSGAAREAFDFTREPQELQERYGVQKAGKDGKLPRPRMPELCLQARRLVEAGVRFVTIGRDSWDHHANIFPQIKGRVPRFDRSFAVLLDDLSERGLLDETLVVYLTEFGRTPRINKDAGRDHWPGTFSVAFAGAGIRGGVVLGKSDGQGAFPTERPVTPEEIAATIYRLVGLSTDAAYVGADRRPRFYNEDHVPAVPEILA